MCNNNCSSNFYADSTTNLCVFRCPENYYGENNTYTCLKCDSACYTCFSDTKNSCNSCQYSNIDNLHYFKRIEKTTCAVDCLYN
jgi:hypothetical protein